MLCCDDDDVDDDDDDERETRDDGRRRVRMCVARERELASERARATALSSE